MVGYISKYLSYTQSCAGCIGRLVYSSKKLASGVARSIQKGLCIIVSLRSTTQVSFCRSTRFDYDARGESVQSIWGSRKEYLYDIVNTVLIMRPVMNDLRHHLGL